MTRQIIGLVGFKGCGKDTVGMILHKKYGYKTTSFARSLKKALCALFGWESQMIEGKTASSRAWRETPDPWWSSHLGKDVTPRHAMQYFGTDLVRKKFSDKFWVLRTQLELEHMQGDVAVTDVRFPDEIEMIRAQGGVIVHVVRGAQPEWMNQAAWLNQQPRWLQPLVLFFMPEVKAVHESERAWIGSHMDYVILNNGTLAQLETQVSNLVADLKDRA